jgi:hypothetical protein
MKTGLPTHTLIAALALCITVCACKKEDKEAAPAPQTTTGGGTDVTGEPTGGDPKVLFFTRLKAVEQYNFYLEVDGSQRLIDNAIGTSSAAPTSCNSSSGESFTLTPGAHSWVFRNSLMGINSSGTFNVQAGECKIIEIKEPSNCWGKGRLLVYADLIIGPDMEVQLAGNSTFYRLTQTYSSPPAPFSNGTFSRYMDPGSYTLKVYDGNGSNGGAYLGQVNFSIQAGQTTPIEVGEN